MDKVYEELWSHQWGEVQKYGPVHSQERRLFEKILTPLSFESILEVGCGQGEKLRALVNRFHPKQYFGIDVAPNALKIAEANLPGGVFEVADIQTAAPNIKADLIVCSNVLEHIPDDQAALVN